MIHEILPVIVGELNEFFKNRFGTNEDKIVLSVLANQDGTIAIQGENKVIVSLINIERDGTNQAFGNSFSRGNAPVHINIYVLFAAYFEPRNYVEALKFISGVIGFFQGKSAFDPHNTPMMPGHGGKIIAEIVNVDFKEISNLWACLGAKYLPSVMYRFRTLDMNEDNIHDQIPPISGITV